MVQWFKHIRRGFGRITGISTPLFGLQWEHNKEDTNGEARHDSMSLPLRLLTFIWNYPCGDQNDVAWAVKESYVLRGYLEKARREPGLGIAILSTELALKAFGSAADGRIDGCVRWALAHTQKEKPYLLLTEKIDPITSSISVEPDFRHSLAFAVILARTRRHYGYLESYLDLTLASQMIDGGWDPGGGATISEVFTVMYAVELLTLCSTNERFTEQQRIHIQQSVDRGIHWLMRKVDTDHLWRSGALSEFAWDGLFTTAWVINRLAPIVDASIEGWTNCVKGSLDSMVRHALSTSVWRGTESDQKFRVESRIAASVSRAVRALPLDGFSKDTATLYLNGWKNQATKWVTSLSDKDLDLATALFLIYALIEPTDVQHYAQQVLKLEQ